MYMTHRKQDMIMMETHALFSKTTRTNVRCETSLMEDIENKYHVKVLGKLENDSESMHGSPIFL